MHSSVGISGDVKRAVAHVYRRVLGPGYRGRPSRGGTSWCGRRRAGGSPGVGMHNPAAVWISRWQLVADATADPQVGRAARVPSPTQVSTAVHLLRHWEVHCTHLQLLEISWNLIGRRGSFSEVKLWLIEHQHSLIALHHMHLCCSQQNYPYPKSQTRKLSSLEDRSPNDSVSNCDPSLDLQSPVSRSHVLHTCKDQGQRSVNLKYKVETNKQTEAIPLPNTVMHSVISSRF